MGFRVFKEFNKALLGKHCWRMLSGGNSLLESVLRSRYYPRGEFVNAGIGYQPSYAWRSILSVREKILQGCRWIVGNGDSIDLWKDRWLPNQPGFILSRPSQELPENSHVSDLMVEATGQWDRSKIFRNFNGDEAVMIVSIPLSSSSPRDKFIWHAEKSGTYSIKTAYHFFINESSRNLPGQQLILG